MLMLIQSLAARLRREEGQSAVEYGVILAVILAVCIVAYVFIGTAVNAALGSITSKL